MRHPKIVNTKRIETEEKKEDKIRNVVYKYIDQLF
jgi:hypothetical protein